MITSAIQSCADVLDGFLTGTMQLVLYVEKIIGNQIQSISHLSFTPMFSVMFYFGVSLIILKFLKKGFDVYITWTTGEPDIAPFNLVVKFIEALVIAISFPYLYSLLANITIELTDTLLQNVVLETQNVDIITMVLNVITSSFFTSIAGLILVIMYFMIFIQFIMRGIEMLILRIGMPVACTGLLDSDKSVFDTYLKKFFQNAVTIMVQVILIKISVILIMSQDIIFGIAVTMLAIKTPKFLQEFMITRNSGGGMSYAVMKSVNMITKLFKK